MDAVTDHGSGDAKICFCKEPGVRASESSTAPLVEERGSRPRMAADSHWCGRQIKSWHMKVTQWSKVCQLVQTTGLSAPPTAVEGHGLSGTYHHEGFKVHQKVRFSSGRKETGEEGGSCKRFARGSCVNP